MCILGVKSRRRQRQGLWYAVGTVMCIITALVYSLFSHGVSSAYMSAMFLYPLTAGLLAFFFFTKPGRLSVNLLACGTATLTVGSCIHGVMDIAGTDTPYQWVYTCIGWVLVAASCAAWLIHRINRSIKRKNTE